MVPIAFHIAMSLEGRRVIATDAGALRAAARVILEQGRGRGLIAFRVADTHVHALLRCSREEAGRFAREVACALRWRLRLEAPFDRSHFEPVLRQSHLARAFLYVLRQEARHGTDFDPLHEGSSLLDTLGLRVVDAELPGRVLSALPRLRRRELTELLGEGGVVLHRVDRHPPLERLAEGAAAALGLVELDSRVPEAVRARCAAQHLARQHDLSNQDIAALLGVSARAVQLLAHRPCIAGDVAAIRGQLSLREAMAKQSRPLLEGSDLFRAHGEDLARQTAWAVGD